VPEIRPFRALRYDVETIGDAARVVAPPYDVISEDLHRRLLERHPRNIVRLDLPAGEPGEDPDERYRRAARTLTAWRSDGTLRKDPRPSVYVYQQVYRVPGTDIERTQRGFLARLRIEPFGPGSSVLPHERTLSGPKEDRYRLLRATGINTSPVVGLYEDASGRAAVALAAVTAHPPITEVTDDDGVLHRLWVVADEGDGSPANVLVSAAAASPVFIADGHHRYETALAYRDERRAAGDSSADTLMVYLCSLSDPGLTVFPTHRLVRGITPLSLDELVAHVRPFFDVVGEPATGAAACRAMLEGLPEQPDPGRVFGLYLPHAEACLTVRTREPAASVRLTADGFSSDAAGLSVTILHELLLRDALGLEHDEAERHVDYAKSVPDALAALDGGGYELGAFLNATLVDQVRAIADHGEVMPQKSTYFYPKLLTGLVFDALGD
jgi:uncharacterized protein (DUF1015 family)